MLQPEKRRSILRIVEIATVFGLLMIQMCEVCRQATQANLLQLEVLFRETVFYEGPFLTIGDVIVVFYLMGHRREKDHHVLREKLKKSYNETSPVVLSLGFTLGDSLDVRIHAFTETETGTQFVLHPDALGLLGEKEPGADFIDAVLWKSVLNGVVMIVMLQI